MRYFIITKRVSPTRKRTILNQQTLANIALIYIKQKPLDLKGEIKTSTMIVVNFNSTLSVTNKQTNNNKSVGIENI